MNFRKKIITGLLASVIFSGCSSTENSRKINIEQESQTTCPGYTKPTLVPINKHPDSYIIYPEQKKDTIYREKENH